MIETERLLLRRPELRDAGAIQRLAGEYAVALNTLLIPHPYPDGAAEEWISRHQEGGREDAFVISLREADEVIGVISLMMKNHDKAEIGYWIGVPYWNRGYATEAAKAIIGYGFGELNLNRIEAGHFARNPASGRVMEKAGMRREGRFRQSMKKWDEYVDVEFYAILRSEWNVFDGRKEAP
jgi:RimJ/RimL family protein N-acetyltransferase